MGAGDRARAHLVRYGSKEKDESRPTSGQRLSGSRNIFLSYGFGIAKYFYRKRPLTVRHFAQTPDGPDLACMDPDLAWTRGRSSRGWIGSLLDIAFFLRECFIKARHDAQHNLHMLHADLVALVMSQRLRRLHHVFDLSTTVSSARTNVTPTPHRAYLSPVQLGLAELGVVGIGQVDVVFHGGGKVLPDLLSRVWCQIVVVQRYVDSRMECLVEAGSSMYRQYSAGSEKKRGGEGSHVPTRLVVRNSIPW